MGNSSKVIAYERLNQAGYLVVRERPKLLARLLGSAYGVNEAGGQYVTLLECRYATERYLVVVLHYKRRGWTGGIRAMFDDLREHGFRHGYHVRAIEINGRSAVLKKRPGMTSKEAYVEFVRRQNAKEKAETQSQRQTTRDARSHRKQRR